MIDFHAHMGNIYRQAYPRRHAITVEELIEQMNREGVEVSVLLPLESPEGCHGFFTTEEAVVARDRYPSRLIAFMCIDPRMSACAELMDHFITHHGVSGFGEHINELAFNDERSKVIYRKCDEHGLPLVFDMNALYCWDEVGLPRFESCLKEFPNVKWVGHGPCFWTAISGDDDRTGGYPDTPITPGGVLDRLFAEYDNLYADISAGSGHNALTRDPSFTPGFLERNWRKLMFGTDGVYAQQDLPQFEWMRSTDMTGEMREAIASGNARKLLGLA
ncbi:MAG TPA: amidohydrolase family protein [Armatimonadota bacterium]|nr:amidohydrolase family protein [Armatimonadota bacterium]